MKDCFPAYAENTVSLTDCGVSADIHVLKGMFVEAFRQCLGGCCESRLSPEEQRLSQKLSMEKYASDNWNLRGDVE
jgi:lipoate-protein ligase A